MKLYQLFDIKLRVPCNRPPQRMTPDQALLANRDLLMEGHRNIGWIEVADTPAPANADLVAALCAVGYSKTKARELAGRAPVGSVEDALKAIFQG